MRNLNRIKMINLNLIMIAFIASLIFTANISFGQHNHKGIDSTKNDLVKDVVCGMDVAKNDSLRVLYNEKDYFFCSNKDMLAFLKQPQKYTGEKTQNHNEHSTDHGMMGMSTPLMIILGAVMITAMVIGMTGVMK